jgi:opacity protein-like surface antigen
MKKKLLTVVLLSALATSAFSADSNTYIGLSYGSFNNGSTNSAIGIQGGFRFTDVIAAEVFYDTITGMPSGASASNLGLQAVGTVPIGVQGLSVFGKLGYVSESYSDSIVGSISTNGLGYGLGFGYDFNKQFTARLGYQGYPTPSGGSAVSQTYLAGIFNY